MLDENPFLERAEETAERESFGVDQADAPVSAGDTLTEQADGFDGFERTEAVASDVPLTLDRPVFGLDDTIALADFVLREVGL